VTRWPGRLYSKGEGSHSEADVRGFEESAAPDVNDAAPKGPSGAAVIMDC